MRESIHPKYQLTSVSCACGYSFQTRSTKPNVHVEICSNCHPFFTGRQKLVDTAGRMERFAKRFEKTSGKTIRAKAKTKAASPVTVAQKILSTSARKVKPAADVKKKADKPAKTEKPTAEKK